MVEYKYNERTDEYVLMEINGRFWGSLQLAIDAGVDFPRLLVERALALRFPPVLEYTEVVSRWEWGEIDHLIARVRRNPDLWTLLRATGTVLKSWLLALAGRNSAEVFRWRDPAPFAIETVQWLRGGR